MEPFNCKFPLVVLWVMFEILVFILSPKLLSVYTWMKTTYFSDTNYNAIFFIFFNSSFLSSHTLFFCAWQRGGDRVKLTKCKTGKWDEKLWPTFRMAPWLFCCFIFILPYIERKWLLMKNVATVLPLKFIFSGKFEYYWWRKFRNADK